MYFLPEGSFFSGDDSDSVRGIQDVSNDMKLAS
jgi:hypothetical protein